ncbi:hypothetical protein [Methylobacterium nigriterrae]|uniref:hypothetical protein n=1 Tax=Methylobacterium nigriterrae TaxID=3127512 RepID=UPI0030134EB2
MTSPATLAADRREAGMQAVAEAQERDAPGYADAAYDAIIRIAERQATVHINDLLAECPLRPERPNSAGSVWMRAIKDGVITFSGGARHCLTDPRKNKHRYPVYLSRLFQGSERLAASAPAPSRQLEMFGGGL